MCAGVLVPSQEGGAEVPGPEGARGGKAGQVSQPLPGQAGTCCACPSVGLERAGWGVLDTTGWVPVVMPGTPECLSITQT